MLRRSMDSSLPTPPPSRNAVRNRETNDEVSSVQVKNSLLPCVMLAFLDGAMLLGLALPAMHCYFSCGDAVITSDWCYATISAAIPG